MTAWSKSNISITGTRVISLDEIYEGMEVLKCQIGEYDATNEMNYFPYILTKEDINRIMEWENSEKDYRYSPGIPTSNFRINK